MSRIGWLLTALLSVLLVVGWYFLLYLPTSDDIADVRAQTETVRTQTTQELARAEALRQVRLNAPEAEAALSAGQLLVPEQTAMPALFRQMQQAADEAGVRLSSITPTPPEVVSVGEMEVASINVTIAATGSYFQVVDLARRIEDPLLTPRALQWRTATLSPSDYPELSVVLSGEVYARGLEQLPTLEEEVPPETEPTEGDGTDDADLEEDLEVTP